MNAGYAVLLGIIQGLTEFLPVSSSAHLVIAQSFFPEFYQPGLLFDIVLHLGTLLAVIFFLRNEILSLLKALLPESWYGAPSSGRPSGRSADRKTIRNLVIATLITGVIGVLFKSEVEKLFASPAVAAFLLVITGCLLFLAGRITNNDREETAMNVTDSIVIGIAQGLAVLPGISRSGATITFGIFRGIKTETAAHFSFLLSIPAVTGAAILQARHISLLSLTDLTAYAAGFAAASITGFLSLKLLFLLIKRSNLAVFAYYCWAVGLSVLIWTAS